MSYVTYGPFQNSPSSGIRHHDISFEAPPQPEQRRSLEFGGILKRIWLKVIRLVENERIGGAINRMPFLSNEHSRDANLDKDAST